MTSNHEKYCLDANVLIQPWRNYYSPKLCPQYWDLFNELGKQDRIFLPQQVFDEIIRTEDDLAAWLKSSHLPIRETTEGVTKCLTNIFNANESHKLLVDNVKGRSLADPWVIAYAINEKACVVTKEEKITQINTSRIKIPNVCDNMKVRWINDFQLVEELGIQFTCEFKTGI